MDPTSREDDENRPPSVFDVDYFCTVTSLIQQEKFNDLLPLAMKTDPPRNLMADPVLNLVIACKKTDLAKRLIQNMPAEKPGPLWYANYQGDTAALALKIAKAYPQLITSRNDAAVTPMQLMVTVPGLFRSLTNLGPLEAAIYKLIPYEEDSGMPRVVDEEKPTDSSDGEVATELVRNNKDIIKERNSKLETPLHKAALYGHRDMFWQYPELITSRNEEAVAPLQLMVTIPELFRSQMVLGSLESFLFRLIPLEEDAPKTRDGDEEAPKSMDRADATEEIEEDDYEHLERPRRIRSKFPSQYTPLLDLLELMHIPARWIQVFLFNILKQLSPRIRRLEEIKRTHREALQLIEHLVHKEEYVDFFSQGTDKGKGHAETSNDNGVDKAAHEHAQEVTGERHRESGGRRDQLVIAFAEKFFKFASHGNDKVTAQELRKCMQDAMGALSAESARWNEPPLILGAQMGLPEYVRTILKVSPEAATYLDTEGRSVLQVAIEHGNLEIVETIREMTEGHNPILPSWLLSSVDETTGETILHFASVKGPDNYQDAVQMQDELRWFEIAQGHRHQIESRNEHALTPLQLLVTIPEAFRSQVVLGALDSFIYDWIPLEEDSSKMNKRDEEAANRSSIGVAQEDDGDHSPRSFRSKFPSNYSTLFDLLEFINIPVSPRVQRMERKKKNHTETMHLIEYLAQAGYFEFFVRGKDPTQVTTIASEALDGQFGPPETPPETVQEGHAEKKDTEAPDAVKELIQGMSDKLYKLVSVESETPVSTAIKEAAQSVEKVLKALSPSSEERWNEPPLILGAQMGLHDFVGKILQVCPQSATYLDTKGRNVLRVAIESGNRETVETIRGMTQGDNPILPSWLLSSIDSKTRNTILHFASEKVGDAGDDAVQMQDEIRWFENRRPANGFSTPKTCDEYDLQKPRGKEVYDDG
ncbi:ANK [Musa troglodytarum]|uniref:ANK n=1 Tax=Musa troglodytarum TaxID=320322 RepID=A0A9E7F9Z9_9LILI|nr:ANK [Musa troglodytarum]